MPGQILYVLCAVVRNILPMIRLISGGRNAWHHMEGDWQEVLQTHRGSAPAGLTSCLGSLGQWHLKYVFTDKSWKFSNQIGITFVHSSFMCVCIQYIHFWRQQMCQNVSYFCFSFYPWIEAVMSDYLIQSIVLDNDEKSHVFSPFPQACNLQGKAI